MIPAHIRAFLRATIKSVWALDVLVAMQSAPGKAWTVAALNERLRASASLVEDILAAFSRAGLVVRENDGRYRYSPASPALEALTSELAKLYAERPMTIIKEIVTAPNEKIRSFVDAFRLKKD